MTGQPSELNPQIDVVDGVHVIRLVNQHVQDELVAESVRNTITELLNDRNRHDGRFLIDLSAIDYFASTGLGLLLAVGTRARRRKCHLRLSGLHGHLDELLQVTNLRQLFDIVPDEATGLAELSKVTMET